MDIGALTGSTSASASCKCIFYDKTGILRPTNANLYHYAGNNPVKYTDPDGKWVLNIGGFGSAGAGVGGSVSAGISIGFSFEKGLTVGVWSSESIGAEFSVDAAAGIIVGLDPFASFVETGNSQTMTIGGSADLGFSIGADYTLDIDSKSSNVTFFGTSGKSATNGKYAIKIGVGASATAVEGHARYNLTQTCTIKDFYNKFLKSMITEYRNKKFLKTTEGWIAENKFTQFTQ